MKILYLVVGKEWYDMLCSGEKPYEYRELKPYWIDRLITFKRELEPAVYDELCNDLKRPTLHHKNISELLKFFDCEFNSFDAIKFKNGYSSSAPSFIREFKGIEIGFPISGLAYNEWLKTNVFVIKTGEILK